MKWENVVKNIRRKANEILINTSVGVEDLLESSYFKSRRCPSSTENLKDDESSDPNA